MDSPEPDFSAAADAVRSNRVTYGPMGDYMASQGMDPAEAMWAARAGRQFTPPAPPKPVSALDAAKNSAVAFYMQDANDPTSASVISGSKSGEALFKLYEPYEFSNFEAGAGKTKRRLLLAPSGQRGIQTPDGRMMTVPVHAIAAKRGVNIVPHKGGDEGGRAFRTMMTDVQTAMDNLADLEELYSNNVWLSGFEPGPDAKRARQIEAMLLQSVGKILNGTKSLGAGVSDRDMQVIESMVPQRASSVFTNINIFTGDSEIEKVRALRSKIEDIMKRSANVNGLEFVEDAPQKRRPASLPAGLTNTK